MDKDYESSASAGVVVDTHLYCPVRMTKPRYWGRLHRSETIGENTGSTSTIGRREARRALLTVGLTWAQPPNAIGHPDMEDRRSKYVVETAETHIGNVTEYLDAQGAWLDCLDNCAGSLRLRFRAVEANMRGFDEWLKCATNGTGKFYADPH